MFAKALPVWLAGRAKEPNVQAGFRTTFAYERGQTVQLKITGSSLYRVYVNGRFVHYGPARAAHGWLRVDELDLTASLVPGRNELAIEVAGYNCPSYYTLDLPSFLQAELLRDGQVARHTGDPIQFRAIALPYRVQKVMRYSFQRTFSEVYRLSHSEGQSDWATKDIFASEQEIVEHGLRFLPREVPLPHFPIVRHWRLVESGTGHRLAESEMPELVQRRFIHQVGEVIKGFQLEEIDEKPFEVLQRVRFTKENSLSTGWGEDGAGPLAIHEGQYILLDLQSNRNGFIQTTLEALRDSRVLVLFDEKLIDGQIDVRRWESVNAIQLDLSASATPYLFESFESYGFRYLQIYVPAGAIRLHGASLREYACPLDQNVTFHSSDPELNAIVEAARETYRQNTVDVFMDCPTRERAGWLCDSYFTAQSALLFSGDPVMEKVFLENFVHAERFPGLPDGMLPMCYPADHPNGNFIPQWAMWYVIELEGYRKRNPQADIQLFRSLCYRLVAYFEPFRNEDGLLEKLDKWNFIEWSKANQWVQDVNYPTNMLYSRMLRLIGGWFDDGDLLQQAAAVREAVIKQSFDGVFFTDNAVRGEDGKLRNTGNRSEVCQYYAFFFGMADPEDEKYAELRRIVQGEFGPSRKIEGRLPEIAYANAFIGNYLRMEILLDWGKYAQVLGEVKGYFSHMVALTGTLWEHDSVHGSLNHGFASYAAVAIIRSLLGLQEIDNRSRIVRFDDTASISAIEASATIGTEQGVIRLNRENKDGSMKLAIEIPEGYRLVRPDQSRSLARKEF